MFAKQKDVQGRPKQRILYVTAPLSINVKISFDRSYRDTIPIQYSVRKIFFAFQIIYMVRFYFMALPAKDLCN